MRILIADDSSPLPQLWTDALAKAVATAPLTKAAKKTGKSAEAVSLLCAANASSDRVPALELGQRVGGVAGTATVDLHPTRLEPLDTAHGGRHQGEAVLGGRDRPLPFLLPGPVGHLEEDAVEAEFVAHVDGGDKVADVGGVERAAEQPESQPPLGRSRHGRGA